jgi:hypothetical protein
LWEPTDDGLPHPGMGYNKGVSLLPDSNQAVAWPWWRRLLLNSGIVYLGLYFLVAGQPLVKLVPDALRFHIGDAVNQLLFGSALPAYRPSGSGDTSLDWMTVLLTLLMSWVAGGLWTWREHRRTPDRRRVWLLRFLRFYLALWLLIYGLAKFNFGQFGLLAPSQLELNVKSMVPASLLWSFMAASPGYQYLAGVAEVTPALLLLHRRTVTLGALVATVTLTNVVALNLFYNVNVKLFSMHLLLTALVVLWFDAPRWLALLRGSAVPALQLPRERRWQQWGGWSLTVACLGAIGFSVWQGQSTWREDRRQTEASPTPLKTSPFHWISEAPNLP